MPLKHHIDLININYCLLTDTHAKCKVFRQSKYLKHNIAIRIYLAHSISGRNQCVSHKSGSILNFAQKGQKCMQVFDIIAVTKPTIRKAQTTSAHDEFYPPTQLRFAPSAGFSIRANFSGSGLSSDLGPLLLRGVDSQIGLTERLSAALNEYTGQSFLLFLYSVG